MKIDKNTFKSNYLYKLYFNWRDMRFRRHEYALAMKTRLAFIKEIIPRNTIGAELGVLKGEFSKILWKYARPEKLHLIDPFYFLNSHWAWTDGDKSTVSAARRILKSFQKEIETGCVLLHIDDDLKVLESFPDDYLDWVYVDSSHTYQHTLAELQVLKLKVKKDGIIAGDDWHTDMNHKHYGVAKAVKEFIGANEYSLIYSNSENLQWAIKKSDTD